MDIDTISQVSQNPETWVGFAKYVFDKAWPFVTGLVMGWLGFNRPSWAHVGRQKEIAK